MNIHQVGEFGLIERVRRGFSNILPSVPVGVGDDAAAIVPSPGKYLLLSTDTLIEGNHFNLSWSSFSDVGYKAVAVNLSDIAAMGGTPLYFLISLGITEKQSLSDIDRLYQGIKKGSREAGIHLLGGNTCSTRGAFFVSLTILGEVPAGRQVTRRGAEVGDRLYVTGTLGDSAAGLILLQRGDQRRQGVGVLVKRHLTPMARFKEGHLLSILQLPSAMIDISDSLAADVGHLMEQSDVGVVLDLWKIPLSPALCRFARWTQCDPLQVALYGGEDYELLFSVPPEKINALERLIAKKTIRAHPIGSVVEKKKGLTGILPSGAVQKIRPVGYDHFRTTSQTLSRTIL